MVFQDPSVDWADPYDGPWKLGFDSFLPHLMLFLFPASYAQIDWSRPYQPLNSELQGILPAEEAATRRYADALYQVWRLDGRRQWIILHLEVQTQPDPDLPRRMFAYSYRVFEKYGAEVFGYAVLGDTSPTFRPGPFVWELGKARLVYEYETAKLIDYPLAELETSDSPAALMILAHRFTQATKRDQLRRRHFKLRLTRLLFRKGYDREQVQSLFKILDWMLRLDREQAIIFTQEAKALREEPEMSNYVNTFEWVFTHLGREEGKQVGREEGNHQGAERVLRSLLVRRFGDLPPWADSRLTAADTETIERWSLQLLEARSLEEVFA